MRIFAFTAQQYYPRLLWGGISWLGSLIFVFAAALDYMLDTLIPKLLPGFLDMPLIRSLQSVPVPVEAWWILAALVFFIGTFRESFRIYRRSHQEADARIQELQRCKDQFDEYMIPKLRIDYISSDHNYNFKDKNIPVQRIRISVQNISGKTIENVSARIVRSEPPATTGVDGLPLLHTHWRDGVLNPGDSLLIDVLCKHQSLPFIDITHSVEKLQSSRMLTTYPSIRERHIWIKVDGKDCAEVPAVEFVVHCLPDGYIEMKRAQHEESTN